VNRIIDYRSTSERLLQCESLNLLIVEERVDCWSKERIIQRIINLRFPIVIRIVSPIVQERPAKVRGARITIGAYRREETHEQERANCESENGFHGVLEGEGCVCECE